MLLELKHSSVSFLISFSSFLSCPCFIYPFNSVIKPTGSAYQVVGACSSSVDSAGFETHMIKGGYEL